MIRALRDDDVQDYVSLRREALLDAPLAFGSSPADDLFSDPKYVCIAIEDFKGEFLFDTFPYQELGTELEIFITEQNHFALLLPFFEFEKGASSFFFEFSFCLF